MSAPVKSSKRLLYRPLSQRHKRRLVQRMLGNNSANFVNDVVEQASQAAVQQTPNLPNEDHIELPGQEAMIEALQEAPLRGNTQENMEMIDAPVEFFYDGNSDFDPEDSTDHSGSDSDEYYTDSVTTEEAFRHELRDYVIRHKLNHVQINGLLHLLRRQPWGTTLPKDSRTFLGTPRKTGIVKLDNGEYYHFGLESGLRKKLMAIAPVEATEITLQLKINIDGLNTSASSGSSFWPILCQIAGTKTRPFPVGIFHGHQKPSCPNQFLKQFVEEFNSTVENGLDVHGKKLNLEILCFICDLPAKSFITCTKNYNGYFSCSKCTVEGDYIDHRMTFLEHTLHGLRSNASFRARAQEEHHTGKTILEKIQGLDMVKAFPIDPMHCVYLGVMRKQLLSLMSGPLGVRLRGATFQKLNENLESLSIHMPKEFARKPRSLNFVKRWKATEFRQFLLYTGPVVLRNCVRRRILYNFLALHSAIRILASPKFHIRFNRLAHDYILLFLDECVKLYGEKQISQNYHLLAHLSKCAQEFGPLEEFSAFPFEDFLGQIKRKLRSGNRPLAQIVRRLAEEGNRTTGEGCHLTNNIPSANFYEEHSEGPVLSEDRNIKLLQYKAICVKNTKITRKTPNNTVILQDGSIIRVRNFVKTPDGASWIIGNKMEGKTDLYNYPLPSSLLDIHRVREISPLLERWSIADIDCKAVCLKMPSDDCDSLNDYAVFPLLHHT